MAKYIILKDKDGRRIDSFELLPGEEANNVLIRLLKTGNIAPLEDGDSIEVVERIG